MTNSPAQSALPLALTELHTQSALAYVLEYHQGQYAAFAPSFSQELMDCPAIMPVPCAADYAYGVIEWRNQWIPLINFAALIDRKQAEKMPQPKYALVLAYQQTPESPVQFGALAAFSVPDSVYVADEDFCGIPADNPIWSQISVSGFRYRERATPIINTSALLSASHR